VPEDPPDHGGPLDEGDQPESPTAARTGQDVEAERPLHQRRPGPVAADCELGAVARGRSGLFSICRRRLARLEPMSAGHLGPRPRPRSEHAKVENQIDARPGHQHRQALEQLERREYQVRRPVAPRVAQREAHPSVVRQVETIGRHGGPQHVPAHPLQPLALPGRNDDARVEAVVVGARRGGVGDLRRRL
jgi:hypothetical protein